MLKKLLSPADRYCEIMFGLIMTMTFTATVSVIESGRQDVRSLLTAVLACNFSWGLIDALFHLISRVSEVARANTLLTKLKPHDVNTARELLEDYLPKEISTIIRKDQLDLLSVELTQKPMNKTRFSIKKNDYLSAVGIFSLVFLSTLPVLFPFVIFQNPIFAIRISNAVAIILLFLTGDMLARQTGTSRFKSGIMTVGLGLLLAGLAIALGG